VISLHGGFSLPTHAFGTEAKFVPDTSFYLEKNYGLKFGFHWFAGELKYAFDRGRHVRGVFGLSYSSFLNPQGILTLGFSHPLRESMNIFSFSLGGEYAIQPKERINPFVGTSFTANFISGEDFDAETRYGLQLDFGVDARFSNSVGGIGGIRFDIVNLFGKETDTSKFYLKYGSVPLSDGEYTYHGNSIKAKTISYLQFYIGLVFYLGQLVKPEE
jgi:hypothetical protein